MCKSFYVLVAVKGDLSAQSASYQQFFFHGIAKRTYDLRRDYVIIVSRFEGSSQSRTDCML